MILVLFRVRVIGKTIYKVRVRVRVRIRTRVLVRVRF